MEGEEKRDLEKERGMIQTSMEFNNSLYHFFNSIMKC